MFAQQGVSLARANLRVGATCRKYMWIINPVCFIRISRQTAERRTVNLADVQRRCRYTSGFQLCSLMYQLQRCTRYNVYLQGICSTSAKLTLSTHAINEFDYNRNFDTFFLPFRYFKFKYFNSGWIRSIAQKFTNIFHKLLIINILVTCACAYHLMIHGLPSERPREGLMVVWDNKG